MKKGRLRDLGKERGKVLLYPEKSEQPTRFESLLRKRKCPLIPSKKLL